MTEYLPLYQRVGVLRSLQHRDFRLLWLGQTVSMIGDGIYVFAVAWFVYKDLDASPATFALVGFAWSAPQVLLLLATGALSDRMDRRHLMILGDLLRLVAIATIGTLILFHALTVPLLVLLVLPYGAGQAIFGPAFHSIIPMIVPDEHLLEAKPTYVAAGRGGLGFAEIAARIVSARHLCHPRWPSGGEPPPTSPEARGESGANSRRR